MRELAINALDRYDLQVTDVQLVGTYTNTLFRVRANGLSHVLRVCTPGWRTLSDLQSEAMWLQALDQDTDIGAPVPRPARNGDLVVQASARGVPEPHHCLVTSWVPGPLLGTRLTEEYLFQMGVLFARLHEHGAGFAPPEGFTRRRMDSIYARDEENVLFGAIDTDAFTPRARDILYRTMAWVHKAYERLYADPSGLRVIHHDLHHDNIKVDRGRLRPLDFEDTVWGYPVQDIAMALQDLMTDVERDEYEPLMEAFRRGYETTFKWPESCRGQIDTFRAGRMFWVANYVARFQRQYLSAHIDWLAGRLEEFLDTCKLRKH